MSEILRLNPHSEGGLVFDLRELLTLAGPTASDFQWRLMRGPGTTEFMFRDEEGSEDDGPGATDLWNEIDHAEQGLSIDWPGLERLGDRIFQSVWLTVLGFSESDEVDLDALFPDGTRYLDRASTSFVEGVSLAFQVVDSSFWFVHARDASLRELYRSRLPQKTRSQRTD